LLKLALDDRSSKRKKKMSISSIMTMLLDYKVDGILVPADLGFKGAVLLTGASVDQQQNNELGCYKCYQS